MSPHLVSCACSRNRADHGQVSHVPCFSILDAVHYCFQTFWGRGCHFIYIEPLSFSQQASQIGLHNINGKHGCAWRAFFLLCLFIGYLVFLWSFWEESGGPSTWRRHLKIEAAVVGQWWSHCCFSSSSSSLQGSLCFYGHSMAFMLF